MLFRFCTSRVCVGRDLSMMAVAVPASGKKATQTETDVRLSDNKDVVCRRVTCQSNDTGRNDSVSENDASLFRRRRWLSRTTRKFIFDFGANGQLREKRQPRFRGVLQRNHWRMARQHMWCKVIRDAEVTFVSVRAKRGAVSLCFLRFGITSWHLRSRNSHSSRWIRSCTLVHLCHAVEWWTALRFSNATADAF